MKGFIRQLAAVCGFATILCTVAGCYHYRNLVDPCWPERYNAIARQNVRDIHNAQANAGHEMDQTIYNWHFETTEKGGASAKLNAAGIEVLKIISRRKPYPDSQIYLQNAQDITYAQGKDADHVIALRKKLNSEREGAIQDFLRTQTAVLGGGFQVTVRDVATPGIDSQPIVGPKSNFQFKGAVPDLYDNFKGRIPASSTGGSVIGGGTQAGQ